MGKTELRIKMAKAIMETGILAFCGVHDDNPEAVADEIYESTKNAIAAAFPHGRGNGTVCGMRSSFFSRLRVRLNYLTRN